MNQNQPSASPPCDPDILSQLEQASCKSDVKALLTRHDVADVNAAWKQLPGVQKAALNLCRIFDGTIFYDLDEDDLLGGGQPPGHP